MNSAEVSVPSVDALVHALQSEDDQVRGPAWQNAAQSGAPAVGPLAALLTHPRFEVARAARRALARIVRHAGRPEAPTEARKVESELATLLRSPVASVRREALSLLSEIGSEDSVAPIARLLADSEVREEARCSLMRFPGPSATASLRRAFEATTDEFRFALAESLRRRGEAVVGYPSRKMTPSKRTNVG